MSTKLEEKEYRFDALKWLVAVALVVGGAVAFTYFDEQYALILRVVAVVAVIALAAFVAVNTAKGAAFWALLKASQVEIRKVVWPTRQEVTQTTLIVVAVVLVAALILWGLDTLIGWLASLVIA
ncbi:preprotein translocase subunit SecE [Agaribacterium haliotis]|uniref:preprotein translocase subunit SecE n=1 Tax=Agaribacterium haliotis TaxID=2013869 RepID=UPI000BB57306|nr:preprotein translocase subunit SecE [Agaribacterium haliotis]